jgi:high-affinity Fe2+/Pb2+ permease
MPTKNPQKQNRRGCFFMVAAAALVALVVAWLVTRIGGDTQQANETMGAGIVQ